MVAEIIGPAEADAAWAFIETSPARRAAAGLWARGWAWQRLTRDILVERIGESHVFGVRSGEQWGALAIANRDDDGQHIGYVDGAGPALEQLARALSGQAKRAGAEFNDAALPPVPTIVSAFRSAGYPHSNEGAGIYIYELGL